MRESRGFTMIELIMVIVIIGILAAIAIPRFIDMRKEANIARCKGDGGALRSAIASFYADRALSNECATAYNATADCWPTGCTNAILSPYIQSWPADPSTYLNAQTWAGNYSSTKGVLDVDTACAP